MQRRTVRQFGPFPDNFSPDITSKLQPKNLVDTAAESHGNMRQFSESPDYVGRRRKDDEGMWAMTVSEISRKLDNNTNELIFLIGKRKNLVLIKKKKLIQLMDDRMQNSKACPDENIAQEEEFQKIVNFCDNSQLAIRMLSKILKIVSEVNEPMADEEEKSEQFWLRNRKLENEIDTVLQKLKAIDKNLQKQNADVHEICRELDRTEETLKSFVGAKNIEQMQKVQPLFHSKKRNYDILNKKIKDREVSKDRKIESIKKIKGVLQELKETREERLKEIAHFFGLEHSWQLEGITLKDDFETGVEELLKLKERDDQLAAAEQEILQEIDVLDREQQRLYSQLMRRQSDEAKAFHNYNAIMSQRSKCASILFMFRGPLFEEDSKDISRRFREHKAFFKRFIDEQVLLKQGLLKTAQTAKTFTSLLKSTENEKERRHELLSLLEACIRKRGEYENKREELRTVQFEESRVGQELIRHEEDLEGVLTDGDLEGYKRIGSAIGKCEGEKTRLLHVRELIEKQMESMDREVVSLANRIQEEYEDILSDVLPSDYEYSLTTGEDVKKLRNHLRKMYKRLGILNTNQ